ncbi:hypothetical protein [Lysinibacillus xylanilyticus]|uniref:hypothetical protein n=1 Tax=Lysinibacillus xylanilyticus TaxID=582475 RepID=UPI003D967A46
MPINRNNDRLTINSRELLEILAKLDGTENTNRSRNRFEETTEEWHPPLVWDPPPEPSNPGDDGDR